ncbi:MAG: 2-amino-4-hydroxy-6-hydroxymethyldihydropteridine diphosphokinase [Pseudomonadota bacterium]
MQKTSDKLPQFRSLALIAVGSNRKWEQLDATSVVSSAIHLSVEALGVIRAKSRFFRTPAFPAGAGPDFVNAAFSVETDLPAHEVLECLHGVESAFGRERRQRWSARTLDLDLIALDGTVLPDMQTYQEWVGLPLEEQMSRTPAELILPHPRLQDRAFVLVPLLEVAPDWVHPATGQTIRQMHNALPENLRQEVQPL